ncbi:GAF domain-containing protein [Actinophytocola glycyrrhizae]|uniref:GAF domain-containing protein n=1 Tax=Actinophytocola glycyrrhizae TaxID=2044873 RepID=UPI00366E1FC4
MGEHQVLNGRSGCRGRRIDDSGQKARARVSSWAPRCPRAARRRRRSGISAEVPAGTDAVTVTVHDAAGPRTVSATSAQVPPADQVQFAAGEGPEREAATTREPLRASVEVAEAAGVRSFLSVPLVIPAADDREDELVGSLNAYGPGADAFAPVDSSLLQLLTAARGRGGQRPSLPAFPRSGAPVADRVGIASGDRAGQRRTNGRSRR